MNIYESTAMWKLYLKSNEGIAIQSTVDRLRDSFDDKGLKVLLGEVKYIDYDEDNIETDEWYKLLFFKRSSFSHEKELRAVIASKEYAWLSECGIQTKISLDTLIEAIYVAPTAPPWFFDLVKSISIKFGITADVRQSSLSASPILH
jgi:hypothetical protein